MTTPTANDTATTGDLIAKVQSGFNEAEFHIKTLSGYEYNAIADYHGEPLSPPEITEARAAFATLSARLQAAEHDSELRDRDFEALKIAYALQAEENEKLRTFAVQVQWAYGEANGTDQHEGMLK